jgi:CheY-like chemotaxis protein
MVLAIGLLISLGFPATNAFLEMAQLRIEAGLAAARLATSIAHDRSIFEEVRRHESVTLIQVVDAAGRPIPGYEHDRRGSGGWLSAVGSAPIMSEGRRVGTAEVTLAQRYLGRGTLGLLLLSSTVGVGIALVVHVFFESPSRAGGRPPLEAQRPPVAAGPSRSAPPATLRATDDVAGPGVASESHRAVERGAPPSAPPVPQRAIGPSAPVSADTRAFVERELKIVLVDDEHAVRGVMAEILEMEGHTVIQAGDGTEALARVAAERGVDLVLTDLGMPGMNGWAVARELKSRHPSLLVGLITGWGDDPQADPADRAVVDFIIGKPVTEENLRAAIANAGSRSPT